MNEAMNRPDYWSIALGVAAPEDLSQPIKQAELERLEELRPLAREYESLRALLREKHLDGVETEPGRYSLRVSRHELRSFSHAKLVRLLGEARAEELRARIEPTIQCRIAVVDSIRLDET